MRTMQSLWPEFENEQLLTISAGRARSFLSSRRRPTEQIVLSSLRDWLLHDYIVPYCRSLAATRIFRRCYWIDGLGGSPIQKPITSAAQLLAEESKPIALHGIILEAKGSSKRKEVNAGDSITIPQESGVVHASWPETASALLQAIDQSAAIFLLNPFTGSPPFSSEDLAPLYSRTAPTELCLFISHRQVESRLLPFLRTSEGTSAFTALLHSDRWKAFLTEDSEIEHTVDRLIDAFLLSVQQQHFLSLQRIALLMQSGPALVETAPYTLIFATRRQDSLQSMNDAVCIYRRRLHEQSHRGVLTEEWFATRQRERLAEEMQQLYQRILQEGRNQRPRRWPNLRQQVLIANFGQFTLYDYDQVICKLLQNGEVSCEWHLKHIEPHGSAGPRIPGNEDTLLWK